jgi:hypothetical protein
MSQTRVGDGTRRAGKQQILHKAREAQPHQDRQRRHYHDQRPSQAEVTLSAYVPVPVSVPFVSPTSLVHRLVAGLKLQYFTAPAAVTSAL